MIKAEGLNEHPCRVLLALQLRSEWLSDSLAHHDSSIMGGRDGGRVG